MRDYVNVTNRELWSRLEGDTWIPHFANGEVWELPLAAGEGGFAMRNLEPAAAPSPTR